MRLRLALACCLVLAACSDGDSGPANAVPAQPWGLFRHDVNNSGAGNSINQNRGEVILLATDFGDVTLSTPTVDNEANVFLGIAEGVISFDRDGDIRWALSTCAPSSGAGATPIGPVSSTLSVQAGGNVVFGSDQVGTAPGGVFFLKEKNNEIECQWVFPPAATPSFGVRSSAQLQIDPFDLSLLSIFIGADRGNLLALNGIGTLRWTFPIGAPATGPITSTPAVSSAGATYITTPNGLLLGVDGAGQPLQGGSWPFPIGVPPAAALLQSPAVNVSVYAIGAGSALFAINPDGTLKWQYQPQEAVLGSPAYVSQSVDEGDQTLFDTIVYLVDADGTLYGVRDTTGQILQIQRCTGAPERSCRTDSCGPGDGTCTRNRCSVSDENCTPDSCVVDNRGTCGFLEPSGMLPMTDGPLAVDTSPVVSGDLFAIVGTADGRVCARALDNTVPGDDDDLDNPWASGCVELGDGLPVLSSPAIGGQSRIYVTTASGLYVIE